MSGSVADLLPWDYFHLGLLLVLIMVLITGIVICVAVIGVCCFHWLDTKEQTERRNRTSSHRTSNSSKTTIQNRDHVVRLDNALNEHMRRNEEVARAKQDIPPPYEDLFPIIPVSVHQNPRQYHQSSSPPMFIIANV